MFTRRIFISAALGTLLVGSQTTTASQSQPGPTPKAGKTSPSIPATSKNLPGSNDALTPSNSRDLHIISVEMKLADDFKRSAKDNDVTNQYILNTLKPAAIKGLTGSNAKGTVPVRAAVELLRFEFAGGVGALLGSSSSVASWRITLYDAETGQPIGRPALAGTATPARPGGLIGIAMIKSPKEEVALVAQNVGKSLNRRLFGFGN